MSFASDAKIEVLNSDISGDCCAMAFLSAIVLCGGQIHKESKKERVVEVVSDYNHLSEKINEIVLQYYGEPCELEIVEEQNALKNIRYKTRFPHAVTERILSDLGLLEREGTSKINTTIPKFIISDTCCKQAYVKGAFVTCATSNIVIKEYSNIFEKNNSGYHLEFIFNKEQLAGDFVELLKQLGIKSKITFRKNMPIVYIKEYQLICDVLALVGANRAVLQLQNEAAIRDLRNNVNRQTNCLNANLTKTVNASVKQLSAIKTIQDNVGLESLSDELMALALIRIANPDESLESLRLLYKYPITKSGIYHRLNKLVEIAKKIEKENLKIHNL